jgi:hypothetical protein
MDQGQEHCKIHKSNWTTQEQNFKKIPAEHGLSAGGELSTLRSIFS